MDLRLLLAEPTAEEREAVDAVVTSPAEQGWDGRAVRGGHDARAQRHLLLPALRAVQRRVGWISEGAMSYVCAQLKVPPADAYGVASFYHMLSLEPRPARVVHVCDDLTCRLRGAEELLAAANGDVERAPCLGLCERAPAALVTEAGPDPREWQLAPATAAALEAPEPSQVTQCYLVPQAGESGLRLLRRVGVVDPMSLDDYRAHGGYTALRTALELGADGVIAEVTASKLLGRGGAAFPTGVKWGAVAHAAPKPHYLVCNADESEPGTFKDRVLMEHDPFAVVEAMTIAGIATGCERGFLYVRAEYPLAHERLAHAIEQARAHGFLGEDVMGRGAAFDIELRHGAGAYICGEETALFNSIEGLRGEPRNKPPFPTEAGLFGKPTVVNNVETLVNVLDILLEGGDAFATIGTEGSTGTRLFCVSGDVERPGLYELTFGATLRELLELAGATGVGSTEPARSGGAGFAGAGAGGAPKAVLLGGAAGTFVGPDDLDLPLTFEDTRAAGATLGSGVVLVYGQEADLVDACLRIAAFFRDESCGQCVPCRVGTVRQEEALKRLAAGTPLGSREDELVLLNELAQAMRDASICGLGQTAWQAVQSAIDRVGAFA